MANNENYWICDGNHDLEIARFVFEDNVDVDTIVAKAESRLSYVTGGKSRSFVQAISEARRTLSSKPLLDIAEALYLYLAEEVRLVYKGEKRFDHANVRQMIRTASHVLRKNGENGGTCVDLVLLFLSCLATAKLDPIYVQICANTGWHALAAFHLDKPSREGSFLFLRDLDVFRRKVEAGQLLVLDCTGFVDGCESRYGTITFAEAQEMARMCLKLLDKSEFGFALDIRQAWSHESRDVGLYSGIPATLRDNIVQAESYIETWARGFFGRDFVFKAIENFLADSENPSGYFVIRGEPGIGKSALLARLVQIRDDCVHHFGSLERDPRRAARNIATQVIGRFDLPYTHLPSEIDTNPAKIVDTILHDAAQRLQQGQRLVVLFDALDELNNEVIPNSIFPVSLDKGIFFVVTARPATPLGAKIGYRKTLDFENKIVRKQNNEDAEGYIRSWLIRNDIQSWLASNGYDDKHFISTVLDKSQGNFMYLHYVLPAIAHGELRAFRLDKIPEGLDEYYSEHWRLMKEKAGELFVSIYKPVVCVLGAVRGSVSTPWVAEVTGIPEEDVRFVIETWRPFLFANGGRSGDPMYKIYHDTFRVFLQTRIDPGLKTYKLMVGKAGKKGLQDLARRRRGME